MDEPASLGLQEEADLQGAPSMVVAAAAEQLASHTGTVAVLAPAVHWALTAINVLLTAYVAFSMW